MASSEQDNLAPSSQPVVEHFWVSSYPFMETSLFVLPKPGSGCSSSILLYDPDGGLINSAQVAFEPDKIGIFELDQFMGSCKIESGLKHAHMVVESSPGSHHFCRLHNSEGAAFLGKPRMISDVQGNFFPIVLSESRRSLLCVVNSGPQEASLKCRLYFGRRTPDTVCTVPGNGSRILSIESAFPECRAGEGKQVQAYLRLSTKSEWPLGVQLVEQGEGRQDQGRFIAVN